MPSVRHRPVVHVGIPAPSPSPTETPTTAQSSTSTSTSLLTASPNAQAVPHSTFPGHRNVLGDHAGYTVSAHSYPHDTTSHFDMSGSNRYSVLGRIISENQLRQRQNYQNNPNSLFVAHSSAFQSPSDGHVHHAHQHRYQHGQQEHNQHHQHHQQLELEQQQQQQQLEQQLEQQQQQLEQQQEEEQDPNTEEVPENDNRDAQQSTAIPAKGNDSDEETESDDQHAPVEANTTTDALSGHTIDPTICTLCDLKFPSVRSLGAHRRWKHNPQQPKASTKPRSNSAGSATKKKQSTSAKPRTQSASSSSTKRRRGSPYVGSKLVTTQRQLANQLAKARGGRASPSPITTTSTRRKRKRSQILREEYGDSSEESERGRSQGACVRKNE